MTQEQQALVFKDLCGRLPYSVYVKTKKFKFPIELRYLSLDTLPNVIPYLRPMHSITGKEWADMNLYGYIDETGKVHIYGRLLENELIHPSVIRKQILKDTKNIMSCEVVHDDKSDVYIAHVEMFPDARKGKVSTMYGANERCRSLIESLGIKIYYRIVDNKESFPLTKSGKRDVKKIAEKGLTNDCFIPIQENGEYKAEYFESTPKTLKKR